MKSLLKKIVVSIITFEAKLVLKKYKPKIVAVTGTVGKTSTKDAIFCAFSNIVYARKSVKSFNSEIGIPLTILGCPNGWNNPIIWLRNFIDGLFLIILPNHYPKWLILEIGADRPGDIESVSRWLTVETAVFTKMSMVPVHVEFFDSPEMLFKEKMSLLKALHSPSQNVVFNSDDEMISEYFSTKEEFKKISYGFGGDAQINVSNYKIVYDTKSKFPTGVNFKINYNGSSLPFFINGTLGKHQIYAVLAAVACAKANEMNLIGALQGLENYQTPPGRMRILGGVKDSLIIDDTYNSSPAALFEALSVLRELKVSGRKIAILGDMMELGKYSVEEHKNAGRISAEFVDLLVTVGVRSHYTAEAALELGFPEEKIMQFDNAELAGKQVELFLKKGDIVLVKGSQAVRMEKAVLEIMAEPMKKDELLVRQEKEWENK